MKVAELTIGGEPENWRELGFSAGTDGVLMLGPVRIELSPSVGPSTIESWSLEGDDVPGSIDGLVTRAAGRSGSGGVLHPNGATSIDHVVVLTPSLDRTSAAFAEIGVGCRRVREAGDGIRQGFFLVSDVLVEVVEHHELPADAPARFWGLTVVVEDIDAAAVALEERLGGVKQAVQPGRRIATVCPDAVGGLPLALMSPR